MRAARKIGLLRGTARLLIAERARDRSCDPRGVMRSSKNLKILEFPLSIQALGDITGAKASQMCVQVRHLVAV